MKLLKTFAITIALAVIPSIARAWEVPKETLSYNIMYKWGLVNKKAGTVTLTTSAPAGGRFNARLTGSTAPWADPIYKLRDTLRGTIDSRRFIPYQYEKIAHEGGDFSHDNISFSHSSSGTSAKVIHRRRKKKEEALTVVEKEMRAEGTTLDMLSAFYYMRNIDYPSLSPGASLRLHVFSGKQAEILTIHFDGKTTIDLNKQKVEAYHIRFTFTSKAGTKTSDPMDAWISTSPRRIPLLMEGKLPVGKVRAVYSGSLS